MRLAQRAIWSFAHFVPKELVQRVVDNSISTELGGLRQEISVLFTDVRDFTTIAESADPDILMHQTSRYFSAVLERAQSAAGSRRASLSGSSCGQAGGRKPQHPV
jgi:adenylate cyclase